MQTALGMFKVREEEIVSADNSAAIFNILSTLPAKLSDVDGLLKAMDLVAGTVVTDVEAMALWANWPINTGCSKR